MVRLKVFDAAEFVGDEASLRILQSERYKLLAAVVEGFASGSSLAGHLFNDYGFEIIGSGMRSHIYRHTELAGLALKVSTPTTGKEAYASGRTQPENLIAQYWVMKALEHHLTQTADTNLTVPKHFFALRVPASQGFLCVQQFMDGWVSLQKWLHVNKVNPSNDNGVINGVRANLKKTLKRFPVAHALNDLYETKLNTGNILVPADTTDPSKDRLCIIDQPGIGLIGRVGALAAKAYVGKNAKELIHGTLEDR